MVFNMVQPVSGNNDEQIFPALEIDIKDITIRVRHTRNRLKEVEALVFDKVLSELREDKINSYNASIVYANMANSLCKVESLRAQLVNVING